MIGGIEETSASFEARSAPRSYPTAGGREVTRVLTASDVKTGGCHSSGISLGDVLKLPKRHPAWRRREAQSGSKKKLTGSDVAANSSCWWCRKYSSGGERLDLHDLAKVGQTFKAVSFAAGQ
jgi:hypothetical protein